jgi:hypothetical protein
VPSAAASSVAVPWVAASSVLERPAYRLQVAAPQACTPLVAAAHTLPVACTQRPEPVQGRLVR